MIPWLWFGCAHREVQAPPEVAAERPVWGTTEAGRYRLRLEEAGSGEWVLWVALPDGTPVEEAEVAVVVGGEARAVGPAPHPGGRFPSRAPAGAPPVEEGSEVRVAVDGPTGLDRGSLPAPGG